MASASPIYPPVDVLKQVAERVWIVDSGPIRVMGMPLPVRMTVIQLADGGIWVHSPTPYNDQLRCEIERMGPIHHLIAPSYAHWRFLLQWQQACPGAIAWATPNLRRRRQVRNSGVRLDRDLTPQPPPDWEGEIEQVIVRGVGGFTEVVFYHLLSRTLVLVDLVQNIEPEKIPRALRPASRLIGIQAPSGRAPVYLRWVVRLKRREAAQAAAHILAWEPKRVIFAHGSWWDRDGSVALRESLGWMAR
jgi:hypothetical protein